MNTDLARRRLHSSGLTRRRFGVPEDVVRWFGAVQAQDYGPAKWSLGQRCTGVADRDVERAFAEGRILRTHIMRPTWHFVLPEDIRWIQELTGPRVRAGNAYMYRQLGLDGDTLARSAAVLADVLRGGRQLTRRELAAALREAGIEADGQRLGYVMMHAELDLVLCSGAPDGKQHTYALLDERAPASVDKRPADPLAELTLRFFTSHGPATVNDFKWWSGLRVADIRRALDTLGERLRGEDVDGLTFWSAADAEPPVVPASPDALILQSYDEYVVAFAESKHLLDVAGLVRSQRSDRPSYNGLIMMDGQLAGHWKRTVTRGTAVMETFEYAPFDAARRRALQRAVEEYGRFIGLPATVE